MGQLFHMKNIEIMNSLPKNGGGWDLIIISTSSYGQRDYWTRRLDQAREKIISPHTRVVVVVEEWKGGAGNGLGSLFAICEADRILAAEGKSVEKFLAEGFSVALFHSAGKGSRLAPLPGAEYNNKSSVKLPGFVNSSGHGPLLTILEGVIKQTAIYSASRKGRLSVFWGDQIFIPSAPVDQIPMGHVEVMGINSGVTCEKEWKQKQMDHYGLLWDFPDGTACQMEKIHFSQFAELKKSERFAKAELSISLGCFSISLEMVTELIHEFHFELEKREGCLNTDLDFWMPLTLDWGLFSELFHAKGIDPERLHVQYNRMQRVKRQIGGGIILHAITIPTDTYWWDFGQVKTYQRNSLGALEKSVEGEALRKFLFLPEPRRGSIVVDSKIGHKEIENSILIDVHAESVEVANSILIHATAPEIMGREILLYNVIESERLSLSDKSVRADVIFPGETDPVKMLTSMSRNGGEDWSEKLPSNRLSYADLYQLNQEVDVDVAENLARVRHGMLRDM
jgi:hypothetical protein